MKITEKQKERIIDALYRAWRKPMKNFSWDERIALIEEYIRKEMER